MKKNSLRTFCIVALLALATVLLFSTSSTATPATGSASSLQTCVEGCDSFYLSFPLSTKHVSTDPKDVVYNALVDHTPPFRWESTDSIIQPYTGEVASGSTFARADEGTTANGRSYWYSGHTGLDMGFDQLGAPVYAAHPASVYAAVENHPEFGNYLVLRDRHWSDYFTTYMHLQRAVVSRDQQLLRGQLIGYVGNTGGLRSSGIHLHFALYWKDFQDKPGYVLDPHGWTSLLNNNIGMGTPVPQHDKWASGESARANPTINPEPVDWNEGTVIGNQYVRKDRSRLPAVPIGYTVRGSDPIESWWSSYKGAPGAPLAQAVSMPGDGNTLIWCQEFEGGTKCSTGYTQPFKDVPPEHWAHRYVGWAKRENIVSGYDKPEDCGTQANTPCFKPNNTLTRGQVTKILIEGFEVRPTTEIDPRFPHFKDVPANHEFFYHIETAYNNRIVSGYDRPEDCGGSDRTPCFKPRNDVTRGQLAKMMAQVGDEVKHWFSAQHGYYTVGGPDYFDVPTDNPFYLHIETLYNAGVIQYRREEDDPGNPHDGAGAGGRFHWQGSATRAQAVQFMHEMVYAVSPPTPAPGIELTPIRYCQYPLECPPQRGSSGLPTPTVRRPDIPVAQPTAMPTVPRP